MKSTQLPDTVVRRTGTPSTVKHGSRLRLRFTNHPLEAFKHTVLTIVAGEAYLPSCE